MVFNPVAGGYLQISQEVGLGAFCVITSFELVEQVKKSGVRPASLLVLQTISQPCFRNISFCLTGDYGPKIKLTCKLLRGQR